MKFQSVLKSVAFGFLAASSVVASPAAEASKEELIESNGK